jgi:2-polyprenyl-3-methyl-5-hydroxy-6-metoxy-1,4-benzoquinol methylase
MGEKPATPNVETAPPSNGPVPRDLNPTTAFFSQGGEDLANHYKKVACFRDRCALFVGGLQRTTPLPAKVLDFGCGPGVLSVELAKLGYDVLGLDGATGMVSTARASLARLGLRTARFEHLDAGFFEPNMGTFDAVVCSSVLEYIEDDVGLLAKLIACVRPGGHLFISIPHSANVFTPIEPLAHAIKLRLTRRREGHLVHSIHRYQRERFMETCQRLGMENIRCTSFECPVLGQLGVRLSRFPFLSRMFFFEARKSIPVKPARAEAVNSHCG